MLDIGERLSTYEPLWENWYKDSYIGGGNFGKVYKLKQNFFGETRYSAVKIIPIMLEQELNSVGEGRSEFIESKKAGMVQEIKNMYKLKGQSNLVQCMAHSIKDILDDDGNVIGFDVLIQMEFYTSLSRFMKENGFLSAEQVEKLSLDIASGLRSMHDINMLHRDIKIDNIYVDRENNFLLGDFGISKQEAISSYSTLAGTQPFIAPEVWKVQHTNRRYTRTADIYSYGITLYYLLNENMLPMVTANSTQNDIDNAVFDRLNGKPFAPPKNGTDRIKSIVMKCCAYAPEERFQSMDEVLNALKDKSYTAPEILTPTPHTASREAYATMYAGNNSPNNGMYNSYQQPQHQYIQSPPSSYANPYIYPTNQPESSPVAQPKGNNKAMILLAIIVVVLLSVLIVLVLFFLLRNDGDNESKSSEAAESNTVLETVVSDESEILTEPEITTAPPETTTTEPTTTTPTETTTTTTTTAAPTDAEIYGYDEFDTTLVVRVDEADTLPLRSQPNKETSDILTRISDGTTVHVLGYKDTGSEIWFRVEYDSIKGWCRGGMLQPNNLGMLFDSIYDKPGLEKWKAKFQLQTPSSTSYYGSASFKGTLYFLPDLSSGVQKRFKSYTTVDVYSKQGDWYYVEFYSDGYYFGWVHQSQLSF